MKRILLITSLLSLAAQTPVHAESKVLAMLLKPEHKQMLTNVGSAISTDAKMLAAQGGEIVKEVLTGAETTLRMPFEVLNYSTTGLVSGVKYLGKNHPLVGVAASLGLCVASAKKADYYDKQFNRQGRAFFYVTSAMASGIATVLFTVAALNKYFPVQLELI